MTLDERRDALRIELEKILDILSVYPMDTPVIPGQNPFLDHLLEKMESKAKELEKLNAVVDSFPFRFWKHCHSMCGLIWILAVCMLVYAFTLAPSFGDVSGLISVFAAFASIAWAAWATSDPF